VRYLGRSVGRIHAGFEIKIPPWTRHMSSLVQGTTTTASIPARLVCGMIAIALRL